MFEKYILDRIFKKYSVICIMKIGCQNLITAVCSTVDCQFNTLERKNCRSQSFVEVSFRLPRKRYKFSKMWQILHFVAFDWACPFVSGNFQVVFCGLF